MEIPSRAPSASDHILPASYEELLQAEHESAPVVQNEAQAGGGTTFLRTCLNGLNALSGVGLLSVPYALSEGGWLSMALLAAVAATLCYTGLLLGRCMAADPAIRTYPDIGERAFGRRGRAIVSAFMYLELYLVAVGFLILDGDNLDKLFPGASVTVGNVALSGKPLFVALVALVIAPTTWLRSLGVLAYISAAGVFASVIIVLSVLWVAAVDGVGFSGQGTPLRLTGLPTALGLYIYCFAGHPVFPTLYTSMKDKSQFPKICFVLCALSYGSMAVLGYLMYGDDVQSQVTLNLPAVLLSSKIAIYTSLLNPFSKYALMIVPIATAIEERIQAGAVVAVVVRTLLVISTVVVAVALPFFGYLMALVGSMLCIGACVALPCVCYLMIAASSVRQAETTAMAGIVVLGCFAAVAGTYSSMMQIVRELW